MLRAGGARQKKPSALDRRLLILLRTRLRSRQLDRAAVTYAFLGESGGLWIALALAGAAADPQRRPRWLAAAGSVPLTLGLNYLVKRAVRRERPRIDGLDPLGRLPGSLAFPSAHAATSFAGALRIAALVPRWRGPLVGAAALMAFTRPYLGVHYPSDVIAGAVVGTVIATALEAAS